MKCSAGSGQTGGPVFSARRFLDPPEAVEEQEQGREEAVEGGAATRVIWKT
jgi:hypothetical protein